MIMHGEDLGVRRVAFAEVRSGSCIILPHLFDSRCSVRSRLLLDSQLLENQLACQPSQSICIVSGLAHAGTNHQQGYSQKQSRGWNCKKTKQNTNNKLNRGRKMAQSKITCSLLSQIFIWQRKAEAGRTIFPRQSSPTASPLSPAWARELGKPCLGKMGRTNNSLKQCLNTSDHNNWSV